MTLWCVPLLQPSGGLLINMVLAKPEPQNAQATEITCQFTNSLGADMTDLLFQASVHTWTTSLARRNTRFFHDPCVSGREIASDSTTKRWRCDRRARSDPLSPVLPSFLSDRRAQVRHDGDAPRVGRRRRRAPRRDGHAGRARDQLDARPEGRVTHVLF